MKEKGCFILPYKRCIPHTRTVLHKKTPTPEEAEKQMAMDALIAKELVEEEVKGATQSKGNKKGKGKKNKKNALHIEEQVALEEAIRNNLKDSTVVSNSQTRTPLNIRPNRLRFKPLRLFTRGFHPHPNDIIFAKRIMYSSITTVDVILLTLTSGSLLQ